MIRDSNDADDAVSPELRAAELEIDTQYQANPLVRLRLAEAGWYFLAFCEEIVVREMVNPSAKNALEYAAFFDNLIVHAKFPVSWLHRSCAPGGQAPAVIDWDFYEPSWRLSQLALQYIPFETAFTYAGFGLVSLSIEDNSIRAAGPILENHAYEAYDRLTSAGGNTDEFSAPSVAQYLERVARGVRVDGNRFHYGLTRDLVHNGLNAFKSAFEQRFLLPGDWQFPRFTMADFALVAQTLAVLSYSHFHARVTAARHGCLGLGVRDALIVTSRRALIRKLQDYTDLNADLVTAIVETLIYGGAGQQTPDPALQPIVQLGSHIAIAPNLVIHSAMERNFAVLLNRMPDERRAYARLSTQREALLRSSLTAGLSGRAVRFWAGNVAGWDKAAEVDLAIVSDEEKRCLILELKAFLAPAEPREVRDRSEEIVDGIDQIRARQAMFLQNPEALRVALDMTPEYSLAWAVASETSIGAAYVQTADVPVVRADHLVRKLRANSMTDVFEWLERRLYVPVLDVHYRVAPIVASIGRWTLHWHDIEALDDGFATS